MIRYLAVTLSLAGMMLGLTSCSERRTAVTKSPDGQIVVYEGRKSAAGPAPDSVTIYLLIAPTVPTDDAKPIFEGQDVGHICYDWPSSSVLNIRISGGYVDNVASQWVGPNGRHIAVRYLGTSGCAWRKSR
jgi:hypothetical protein